MSSTLLRNMREKDLRKAIGFHMKKTQSQHDPKQKSLSVDQARINYLEELSDLKSFGGKSFGATLMVGFFQLIKRKKADIDQQDFLNSFVFFFKLHFLSCAVFISLSVLLRASSFKTESQW